MRSLLLNLPQASSSNQDRVLCHACAASKITTRDAIRSTHRRRQFAITRDLFRQTIWPGNHGPRWAIETVQDTIRCNLVMRIRGPNHQGINAYEAKSERISESAAIEPMNSPVSKFANPGPGIEICEKCIGVRRLNIAQCHFS
jgi:hypothetical protein